MTNKLQSDLEILRAEINPGECHTLKKIRACAGVALKALSRFREARTEESLIYLEDWVFQIYGHSLGLEFSPLGDSLYQIRKLCKNAKDSMVRLAEDFYEI